MPRKGENIYQRKDKRWEGRYLKCRKMDGSIQYGYIYGKSYTEVKEQMHYYHALKFSQPYSSMTISQAAAIWLDRKATHVKPSTFATYDTILRCQILPQLGKQKIFEVSPQTVDQFLSDKRKEGGSPKYVYDILGILKSVLLLVEREYGLPNPAKYSHVPKSKPSAAIRVFTRQEQKCLETYLLRRYDTRSLGILLCLYTGMRIGELCALQWNDISIEEGTIQVTATIQRIRSLELECQKTVVIRSTPKTRHSIRQIPLPPFVTSMLRAFHNAHTILPDMYFLTSHVRRFIEPRVYREYFKQCLYECGLDDINFHALRHTFATRCIEEGFDIKSLSEILGHATVEITLNKYVHSSNELKRKYMGMLKPLFV